MTWNRYCAMEIWRATDGRGCTDVAEGFDGGKNAHYMLRWVNTKEQKGPWSETATATIGA